jgi:hypothetical protein
MRIRWDVQLFDPKRPNEICRLTDQDYAHLLDTIKQQTIALRTGRHATLTAADGQEELARQSVNWVVWMIVNSIYRFSDLDEDDFTSYLESAIYGPGHLFGYGERLTKYVDSLKSKGEDLPKVQRSGMKLKSLNAYKLLEAAGIDPHKGGVDYATSYKLADLSARAGLYLTKAQKQTLANGPRPLKPMTLIGVNRLLQPWANQWLLRNELPGDHIRFNPFEDVSLTQLASENGRTVSRTKTAPVLQTMELIDRSIYWVLEYAEVLLDLRDQFVELAERPMTTPKRERITRRMAQANIPEGPGRPFPLTASSRRSVTNGLELGVAVSRFLPTACAVVICAFTGRRRDEVMSARAAGPTNDVCITHDEEGFWLELFIEKTCQDWIKTPCNELVVAAIKVLERWSEPARASSGRTNLFQLQRLRSKQVVRFRVGLCLKDFVAFLKLTALPDGSEWIFTPHQLRRFFAMMYYWRYEYRNLGALSHHLRHIDPAMTQVYVTEREAGEIFKEVGKDHTVALLTDTAIGLRNLSGAFGERFKAVVRKLCVRFTKTTKVISPNLVRRVVERYVIKSGRRLKGMPWGYCACGARSHELRMARCLDGEDSKSSAGPDFSNSSPVICCNCPHHATEKTFEPFLRDQIEFHERAAADRKNGSILRAASREHVKTLRLHYERCFQNAQPVRISDGKATH